MTPENLSRTLAGLNETGVSGTGREIVITARDALSKLARPNALIDGRAGESGGYRAFTRAADATLSPGWIMTRSPSESPLDPPTQGPRVTRWPTRRTIMTGGAVPGVTVLWSN
jgi:hypothetical protein